MKDISTFLLALTTLAGFGQQFPNSGFLNPQPVPCPADTTQTVMGYPEWEAYQTFNDEWDGPIDTNICIDLGLLPWRASIPFSQTDLSRKVFVRSKMDSTSFVPFQPHELYFLVDYIGIPPDMVFDTTGACPNGLCSGSITLVQIPDSTGNGTTLREYRGAMDVGFGYDEKYSTCIAAEKFTEQYVVEHVMAFKTTNIGQNDTLRLMAVEFTQTAPPFGLTNVSVETKRTGQFEYVLNSFENGVVQYQDATYPSPDSISYLELIPDPNVPVQSMINFTVAPYTGFHYELFTQMRGAIVLGDTIRHNINIVNQGMQCISGIVEIVYSDGDRFTFAGGKVELADPHTCFQFGSGGALAVADNVTFRFGAPGRGILALRTGAEVEIGRNAELVICNKLYLQEYWEETQSQNIEITLGQGSRLTFAPGACIDNSNSIGQNMKLVVYLDGGSVDLSGLCLSDREKVVVKRLPKKNESTLRLFGNAVSTSLDLELLSRQETSALLSIYSSTGAFISSTVVLLNKGKNRTALDLSAMADGLYIIEALHGGKRETARFVKAD